jgi:general secretion pathway protein F
MVARTYSYVAYDARGRARHGVREAAGELELDRELERAGLMLASAKPGAAAKRRRFALRADELVSVTAQLATMLSAGVPVTEALEGIGRRDPGRDVARLMDELVGRLRAGEGLSGAMAACGRTFPAVYVASVRAGEASGALDKILLRVAAHLEWTRQMRATAAQALIYPALLLLAICGLVAVLLYFVLPRVLLLYPGGRGDLPAQTKLVIALSDFVRANGVALAAAAFGAAVAGRAALRWPRSRLAIDRGLLAIPKLGALARQIAVSRFASTAATLQSAGCDVFAVLAIARDACGNRALAAAVDRAAEEVRSGTPISEALGREPLVDPLLVQMFAVGEQTGRLDECLGRLARFYDDEIPRAVKKFLAFLEPCLLLGAGVVVAFILLAALMPIFKLYQTIGA